MMAARSRPICHILRLLAFVLAGLSFIAPAWSSPGADADDADADADAVEEYAPDPTAILARPTGGRAVLGRPSGAAYLSVGGFSLTTLDDRREVGGMLFLELPLDRAARGSTRVTSDPAPAGLWRRGGLPLERVSAVPQARQEQPFDLALTPRFARACVAAGWRAAGLGADDARLDAIVSRARWSALLPEVRVRGMRWDDARLALDTYSTDNSRLSDSASARVGFEGRLAWRLDRLLYADDEPAFERLRLEHRDARARIAGKVLDALFQWQRAALDLRTLPPGQEGTRDEAEARLRVLEAESVLDVLTSGWFLAEKARLPRGPSSSYAAPFPIAPSGGDL